MQTNPKIENVKTDYRREVVWKCARIEMYYVNNFFNIPVRTYDAVKVGIERFQSKNNDRLW